MTASTRVRLLHAPRSLDDFAGEWARLAHLTQAGPFQAFGWAASWWAVYGDGLQALPALVWRDDVVVGIIPLALRPRPEGGNDVIFIGTGMSDYLDWLLDADVDPARVLDGLLVQLDLAGLVHLDLMDIPDRSRLGRVLRAARLGSQVVVALSQVCPIVDLPASPITYVGSRSRNLREAIRRAHRKAERCGVDPLVVHRSADSCQRALPQFFEMHLAWWQERSQGSVLATAPRQEFLGLAIPAVADAGFVELSCRYCNDELVSAFIILRHRRVRYYYQSALNPAFAAIAPGVGHMADELTRAILDRAVTFDLLRGEEPYKRRWATSATCTWRAKGSLR